MLTQQEKKWVMREIEMDIDSIRIDGDYNHGVTFDRKCFTPEDFEKHDIAMLERFYKKLKKGGY